MGLDNAYGVGTLKSGVCTSSTRPASPYDGQVIYETDTDMVRVWDGSTWDVVGTGVFTSTTRPSSPYEGKLIYETDTDLVCAWNGSSWVTVGPYTPVAIAAGSSNVSTSQTITSGSYSDLATVQSVTITTGTSATISMGFTFTRPSPEATVYMSFAVSGATTRAAQTSEGCYGYTYSHSQLVVSRTVRITGLNAGSNTFTAKFATSVACNAFDRTFAVMAI